MNYRLIAIVTMCVLVAAGGVLLSCGGCGAQQAQTVKHDAAIVAICLPPSVVDLEQCKASGRPATSCDVEALGKLAACVLSAPPAAPPAPTLPPTPAVPVDAGGGGAP